MSEAYPAISTRPQGGMRCAFPPYTDMLLFERNAIPAKAWVHIIRDPDAE
jgi:hypothetical protein